MRLAEITNTCAYHVDAAAGMGGFLYFIGSILFLPSFFFVQTTFVAHIAPTVFTLGGIAFTWSGIAIFYQHFYGGFQKQH